MQNEIDKNILAFLQIPKDELIKQHPPKFINRNKNFLYSLHSPSLVCTIAPPPTDEELEKVDEPPKSSLLLVDETSSSTTSSEQEMIVYCRYKSMKRPSQYSSAKTKVIVTPDIFKYDERVEESHAKHWYMNFAHSQLFVAWRSSLFAQDEIQVCEHPSLGSLKEYLMKKCQTNTNLTPLTVQTTATPILIKNVDRKISVNVTDFDLYGNKFSAASEDLIRKASTVLDSNSRKSNIVAMEAPTGGKGEYQMQDVTYIFDSAYTGFRACKLETERDNGFDGNSTTVIHTGHWGGGAYGNNKELMAILQILAAKVANVDYLFYHAFDQEGVETVEKAIAVLDGLTKQDISLNKLFIEIVELGYKFGFSDGN